MLAADSQSVNLVFALTLTVKFSWCSTFPSFVRFASSGESSPVALHELAITLIDRCECNRLFSTVGDFMLKKTVLIALGLAALVLVAAKFLLYQH
jgi:hypothetical protein